MSNTYSIGCRDCKKCLWIAQGSSGNRALYSEEAHTMAALEAFLFEHQGHALVFDDNINSEILDWEKIKNEQPAPSVISRHPAGVNPTTK